MIKNNALGDRLNAFKNKTNPSEEISDPLLDKSIFKVFSGILVGILNILKVFVFGYSAKIVFNTNWNFWSTICIGFAITFLLIYMNDLIHKDK